MLGELEHRWSNGEACLAAGHGREPLAFADALRQVRVEEFFHLGLIVVKVLLRRSPYQVQINAALGLGSEVGQGIHAAYPVRLGKGGFCIGPLQVR